jgi:hypothetical protein
MKGRKADLGRVDDRSLRPGDIVEVRSAAEILATLDRDASTDAMPFMPEMLRYSGKRFTVSRRVEKICDTVSGGFPRSLRMRDTVLLDDLRCDGSAHGECQAGCRLYWKEAWLRRVDAGLEREGRNGDALAELEGLVRDATVAVFGDEGSSVESYRCQATEALRASEPLSRYDPRQYIRELTSGNLGLARFLRVAVRALRTTIGRRLRLLSWQPLPYRGVPSPTRGGLDLQPGDTVEVRSPEEIAPSVDKAGRTRGLSFDFEMLPYCGGRYRVQDRVERIIDEGTGRMIEISSDCLILDGVVCSGEHSNCRYFCPRAIYPFWREAWLRRVEDSNTPSSGDRDAEVHNPQERWPEA